MRVIEIKPLPNGAHRSIRNTPYIPHGYAVIPDGMVLDGFPYGNIETEKIGGVLTVTKWVPLESPITPIEEPSANELINILLGVEDE